ncbi:MAG TPA: YihY/virulence factor BrkB family protein [Chthoniobacter sp.]|nr:YihY/virulence factor BrkB family protein [Chthoniobacter sp.]
MGIGPVSEACRRSGNGERMKGMIAPAKPGIFSIFKQAMTQWSDNNALRLSAALAYYSIFSIAPLIVIAIAIAGWMFGHEAAQGMLAQQLRDLVGGKAAEGIEGMVQSASKPASSVLAGIMGAVTLLLGASGVFGQLKDALNTVWGVKAKPGQGVAQYIRERLLSFGMVLVIGFLLLVSLTLTTALAGLTAYLGSAFPLSKALTAILGFCLSFGTITLLFAAVFKILPDAKVKWRDVWIGAAVTGLLFEIGKFLLAFYLGRESTASAYGAAASAVLLLLWVYYASLILLFGAEFTLAYAQAHGSKIVPAANAETIMPETRAQEGLSPSTAKQVEVEHSLAHQPAKESPRIILGIADSRIEPPEAVDPVSAFIESNPVTALLGAVGGGLTVGLILRQFEAGPHLSPGDQVKAGSKALALAGAAATAAYFSRVKSKAKESIQHLEVEENVPALAKQIRKFARAKLEDILR